MKVPSLACCRRLFHEVGFYWKRSMLRVAPMLVREPERISLVDLAKRFEGVGLTQSEIQRAAEIGLFEIDSAEVIDAGMICSAQAG